MIQESQQTTWDKQNIVDYGIFTICRILAIKRFERFWKYATYPN